MFSLSPRRLHSLLVMPALLPFLFLFGSSTPSNNAPNAVDANYTVHGTFSGSFPFTDPFRLVSNGSVSHGTLRVFSIAGGYSQDSFTYEASYGYVGSDSFTYQGCDTSNNCVDGTVNLNVQNGAPHAVTDEYILHGVLYGGGDTPLTLNDSDPDGDPLRAVSVTPASHGSFRYFFDYDSFIYEPNYGFTGIDSVNYQVCDSLGLCDTGTVILNAVNASPDAVDDTYTVHGSLTVGGPNALCENDVDPDGDAFSVVAYSQASHGTFTYFSPQGSFTYVPDLGYTGPDHITYQVCDYLGLCDTAIANFNVVNSPPVANPDEFVTHANEMLNVPGPGALTGNDSDPDGDQYHVTSITLTSHGVVSYNFQNGSLSYQPNQDFVGTDSFTYQLCDYPGLCANATVTIRVLVADRRENSGTGSCNKTVGGPVNVTNGNMYLQQTDYQLPGVGPAINITRTYNSISQDIGLFGKGWSSDYDESIRISTSDYVRWIRADGQVTNFMRSSGSGRFAPVEGDFYGSLIQNGDGSFTVSFKDGSVHRFTSAGKLLSLVDINRNQTSLAYVSGKLSSITDPFGRVVTATTDTSGRVLTISDSIGKFATYVYGGSGQLLSVTYADNSKYQFAYTTANSNLVLATVTNALGNILENHTYDSQGRAITSEKHGGVERYTLSFASDTETDVTDALGHVSKYFFDKTKGRNVVTQVQGLCSCGGGSQTQSWTYDNQMNVTSHTNALGQVATYVYDANGNQISAAGVLGTSSFTYNALGEVLSATDAMNGATTNTYDSAGNLLSVTDALDNTTNFTYDARGELLTMTNARGKATTLTYDASGNISQTTDALGDVTKFTYDARGRVSSVTDALTFKTSYAYDAAGRLNKVTRADNSIISFTYDLAGRRTKVTDPLKFSTSFSYDSAYRLIGETDALSKSVSYSYDSMSNLIATTDQLGHTTNVAYDEFNRPTTITYPPAVAGGPRLQETIGYDAGGNVASRTDTAGRVTNFAYDAANRLVSVTDSLLQVTQYEYNARSNVTAVVDALNQRYTFDYDALSRVTATTRAGLQMNYAYDAVGNRTRRTDYNNMPTNYEYDALNRLTKITYPDSTTATYGYDKLSQLTSAANINGTVSFVYDKLRRLASTTDVWGQAISYVYDVNDRRTQMNLGSTKFATYTYDSVGRLTKITDNANKNTSYTYDAASNLLTRTLSNGVVSTYTYDGMDRLTRLKDAKGTTVIADNNYTYNNANQIIQNIDQSGTHAYGYDVVDRLTSASYPASGNEAYAYDSVGNRTSSHRSASYNYQPNNRLTSTASAGYLYDNNGNMTAKSDGAGTTQFVWDFENRLTNVVTPSAGSVTYKYDALGRRIQRTPSSGVSTNFSYDGADVVRDKNSDATTIDYLNGPGVDNKIWQKGAAQYFFSQDHLGSTTALTNTSGALVERETYDAYGNTSGSALTRYGYTGRERDSITGLMYYRARWYDTQLGRFVSEDPIGLGGGINQFAYVGNNPQNRFDPSGLYDIDVHYYLTYYLAKATGCFSDSEAREIAEGDLHSDIDDDKKPGWGMKWKWTWRGYVPVPDEAQQKRNADFHAFGTVEQNAKRAAELLAQASRGGGSLWAFGTYLHFGQDSYSHSEYAGNTTWGQSSGINSRDHTSFDPEKAMKMAHDTYDKLKSFGEMRGCHCHGDPDWDLVRKFVDVGYDRSTLLGKGGEYLKGVSDDQLREKIGILGVPWRSHTGR